jgi:peptide/nickel transport system substrate-binding protein
MGRRHAGKRMVAAGIMLAGIGGGLTTGHSGATTEPGGAQTAGGTLVFGASNDPRILDPALASDGESLRVSSQIFETLVTTAPGTTEVIPLLATEWSASDDGLAWTFELHQGVTFHDGEPFNAEAVCFNFDRWYNFAGPLQLNSGAYYWRVIFGGFAENDPDSDAPETSLYESCEAVDEDTVVINLTSPSATFLSGLVLPPFSIASPAALTEYDADNASLDPDGNPVPQGTFGTEHPIGTGPFVFDEWIRNDRLTLTRNDDYWGEPALLDEVIFRPIPDNAARLQALQTGEIDGYDLVDPQDRETIASDSELQLIERPSFNVGYVAFNQQYAPLDNIDVRRAIAHALNRQAVVDNVYGDSGEVPTVFMPPSVQGWTDDVTIYDYDPDEARALLEGTGLELPIAIDFWYPADVSRPYMPDPRRIAEAFASDLGQVGFDVNLVSAPWTPDYLDATLGGQAPVHLLGQTGDFGDPETFVGTFFRTESPQWGFDNPDLRQALEDALRITDVDERTAAYEEINRTIMDFLPGVPFAHSTSNLAFRANVEGFVASPVTTEGFQTVSIEG